jgi:Hypothetical glycosyl hydrolase 6
MKRSSIYLTAIIFTGIGLLFSANCYSQSVKGSSNIAEGSRQVHLDFHTSEAIPGIGRNFSKEQFQKALSVGHINSINIFAKGHHGWTYFPSEVGEQHPNLDFDLLGQQIEACHDAGVSAQAYVTVGWSAKDAREHPEWILWPEKDKEPVTIEARKKENPDAPFGWGWDLLSPEGEYKKHLLALTEELCMKYDLDGFWFDIVPVWDINYNPGAINDMNKKGVDVDDLQQVRDYHSAKMNLFMSDIRNLINKLKPEASVYFNWSTHTYTMDTYKYRFFDHNTKMDLEDLPTTWGGYDKFPLRAKYFTNLGKPVVAMSGKFHKAWGEFGGFKYKDAIWYEAAAMVSFGAAVNFGDQLHPSGEMEMATYENIGYAYEKVEKIEAYGVGAKHKSSLGLWLVTSFDSNNGIAKMLLENQVNFVIANNLGDWSDLKTIIIPGECEFSEDDKNKLDEFLKVGGKMILMDKAGLDREKKKFIFDIGAEYIGQATADIDYTIAGDKVITNLFKAPFLNYKPALKVKPDEGTEVLAAIREPYFNRTLRHYSSHANTPFKLTDADHPAIIRNGNIAYIATDLAEMYNEHGAKVHRDLFNNVLSIMHTDRMLRVSLPSSGRVNLLYQPEHKRYVAHLLYATPIQRGAVQVIEDLVPIYDTQVILDVPEKVTSVRLIPDNTTLEFTETKSGVSVIVPEFKCHSAVVFEY